MFTGERTPFKHFILILAVVFLVETAVMLVLPSIVTWHGAWWVNALIDALLLTTIAAPLLWQQIVIPLRALAKSRRNLLEAMIRQQEEERRRIARDLHDEVGQSVTSILVGLRNLEESNDADRVSRTQAIRGIVMQLLDEVRRVARGLRPAVLDDLGLRIALERLAEDAGKASGVQITMVASQLGDRRFPRDLEIGLYRIVQEALTNITRHAKADRAEVTAALTSNSIRVLIRDQGRGFDVSANESVEPGRHIGLASMRERTHLLRGRFQLESVPGRGTTIQVQIPIAETIHGQDPNPAG